MTRPDASSGDLREAGRGFLLISGAKIWFLLTATFASLAFPRLFGDAAAFGRYRVVSGVLNVLTMVVVTASVQAVARLSSEAGADVRGVRRLALGVQAAVFGPVFLALLLGADLLASGVLNDEALAAPLRAASLVVLAYTFYTVLIGLLNGTRHFGRQAGLDITFSTLKTGLMVAAVVATGSVTWAFLGFAATSLVVLALAVPVAAVALKEVPAGGRTPSAREFLRYLLPLAAYALVLNLLLQADVVSLKAMLGRAGGEGAANAASVAAGVYGAARNVSLLPYQAVISLTFIVFPLVSRATSRGDGVAAGAAATGALRLAAVLSFAAIAAFGAAPEGLLGLLFGPAYQAGGPVLVPLLASGALMAVTFVGNAILASAGRPAAPLWGGLGSVWMLAACLGVGLESVAGSEAAMTVAAWSTLAAAATGAGITGVLVRGAFKGAPWMRTTACSVVAAAAGLGGAALLPGEVPGVLRMVLSFAAFVGVLPAIGGVGAEDVRRIRIAFKRRP